MKYKNIIIFIFISINLQSRNYIDYESPYHPVTGTLGMVVTQNYLSSEIGIEILNKGGNAVDAAVAVGFSLATTLPRAGNLGGGGFMLVYIKDRNEIFFIDYRSSSPLNSNLENIFDLSINSNKELESLPKNFNENKYKLVNTGYKASAVPGTVAGLLEAHEQFGKLSLEEILKPVIKQAKEGVEVTYDLHKAIDSSPRLKSDDESRNIYFKDNKPPKENSNFYCSRIGKYYFINC